MLPRVRYGRVVLTPAQWRLARAGGRTGCGELPAKDPKAFDAAVSRWRQRWQVPQLVYLSAGDNRLLLDLDQPEQREQLRQELLGLMAGRQLILEEPLPAPNTPGYGTQRALRHRVRRPLGAGRWDQHGQTAAGRNVA